MENNVFARKAEGLTLEDYLRPAGEGRENLGDELPVMVYRLFQYTLKDELIKEYGKDQTVEIFRRAGYTAGEYFAKHYLDLKADFNAFVAELIAKLEENKIGVLRIEKFDEKTEKIVLTVSEDADCSGLPILGETVCNYDEGFISGVLSTYTGKPYNAVEIDCWATGDRVCRFDVSRKDR